MNTNINITQTQKNETFFIGYFSLQKVWGVIQKNDARQ